jgi:hypothetical protein
MIRLLTVLIALASSAAPAWAQDRCEGLSITRLIEPRSPDYDEAEGVDEPIRLTVVRSTGRSNCQFFINFVSEAGGGRERFLSGGGGELRYEIIDEGGQVLENTTRGRDRLSGRFRRDETELKLTVRLSIPSGQVAPAGDYAERIAVRLFDQRGGGRLADEQGLTLRTQVHSRAEINLARQPGLGFDAGRSYDVVDFEELETGESRAIVLRVRANAAYRLTLTSENAGALVREGGRREERIAMQRAWTGGRWTCQHRRFSCAIRWRRARPRS